MDAKSEKLCSSNKKNKKEQDLLKATNEKMNIRGQKTDSNLATREQNYHEYAATAHIPIQQKGKSHPVEA